MICCDYRYTPFSLFSSCLTLTLSCTPSSYLSHLSQSPSPSLSVQFSIFLTFTLSFPFLQYIFIPLSNFQLLCSFLFPLSSLFLSPYLSFFISFYLSNSLSPSHSLCLPLSFPFFILLYWLQSCNFNNTFLLISNKISKKAFTQESWLSIQNFKLLKI